MPPVTIRPMSADAPAAKPTPDWSVIEAEYRAGVKPLRLIAEEHGITHGAINKRAKRDEWARDLGAKIQAKANALVSKAAVSTEVSAAKKVTEQAIVEANATVQYTVRMEHRTDIKRARTLFQTLLGELEVLGSSGDLARDLFEMINDPEDGDEPKSEAAKNRIYQMRRTLEAVLSVPGRIDSGKKAVEMLEKLVRMEREAFGIGADDGDDRNKGGARTVIVPAKDFA
jgi:hypothetical protein